MKKLLLVLLALSSISAFAEICGKIQKLEIYQSGQGSMTLENGSYFVLPTAALSAAAVAYEISESIVCVGMVEGAYANLISRKK